MKFENLETGDFITAPNIPVGEFQGITKLNIEDQEISFFKIFESKKGIFHQIPVDKIDQLELLPKKEHFKKNLKLLANSENIQIPKNLKTSRYDFIKDLSQRAGVKPYFKALGILVNLSEEKTLTVAERKLFNKMKEKFISDVETILGEDKVQARRYLRFAS